MVYYIRGNSFLIFFHYIHQGLNLIMKIRIDDTGIKSYLNHTPFKIDIRGSYHVLPSSIYSVWGNNKIVPQKNTHPMK